MLQKYKLFFFLFLVQLFLSVGGVQYFKRQHVQCCTQRFKKSSPLPAKEVIPFERDYLLIL